MRLSFKNKKISGILVVVPANVALFEDEMGNYEFSIETSIKLKETMGYNQHRIVAGNVCVSDLCVFGLNWIFEKGLLKKEDIDALILVTETPDYIIPPTSNVIQGELGLKEDMICMDINQGCAGYEIGLIQAFMLLEQDTINKVVLLNAEVMSRKVSKRDRNSFPLSGDGASITIVEKSSSPSNIFAEIKMDGSGAFAIQIPAGGMRLPSSPATCIEQKDDAGNWRSLDNLVMKGDEVFMFVQKKVPPLIEEVCEFSGMPKDEIDYFMFHQPNKFMLRKLARKLKIPEAKLPTNIVENFGNSSGVTVPLNIAFNIGERLEKEEFKMCLAGFGIGLVWGAIIMDMGPLDFCNLIEYQE